MKYPPVKPFRILAIAPNSDGLGFAVLETDPFQLVDWGVKTCRPRNRIALKKVVVLLERYQPSIVVLEDCDGNHSRHRRRIRNLIEAIIELCVKQRLGVRTFSRRDVLNTFSFAEAKNKYEIAVALTHIFPELGSRLPRQRKNYMDEDYRMVIFEAVAIGIAASPGSY